MRCSLWLMCWFILSHGEFALAADPPDAGAKLPDVGANAALNGWLPMNEESEWNRPVDQDPPDPRSAKLLSTIKYTSGRFAGHAWLHPDFGPGVGIPYLVVDNAPPTQVSIRLTEESEKGPWPIPLGAPIEMGSDHHVIVLDRKRKKLYELFSAEHSGKSWRADSGAIFDSEGEDRQRPAHWTSADAAGLPIFPGLVKYDEVVSGEIKHALRFTAPKTRKAFVYPASHYASQDTSPDLPPMGMRIRLKKSFDTKPYGRKVRTILKCLQKYGAILADNGSPFFISGAPHADWNNDELGEIKRVRDNLLFDSLEVIEIDPNRLTAGD
jgi:hypothetical protein